MTEQHNEINNPFPGLRPFTEEEESYFFGREKAVTDLVTRLRTTRFLTVTGTSGSGKSSLIFAGLLPSLYRGIMVRAGSHWRTAVFRPGGDPIGNLSRALENAGVVQKHALDESDPEGNAMACQFIETTLRRSNRGLSNAVRQAALPKGENLLIVVDQLEELFRFRHLEHSRDDGIRDSAAFIKLLMVAGRQSRYPIYIILTMRSDFLGDCAVFTGLPEMINRGQYLVPRMTREEKRAAITGPIAVEKGAISPPLISRLLNDVGDNPDQLPILQHALMRTWDHYHKTCAEAMDISHYEAVGTMTHALSQHAEEAYAQLKSKDARVLCEKLFKRITHLGKTGRGVRRPARVDEICKVTGCSITLVLEVIDLFRQPGRTFLMPTHGVELDTNSVIDISHESFMRIWQRLEDWVQEEGQSAELYERLAKASVLYRAGKVGLWRDPELMLALKWKQDNQPNDAWGKRYAPNFTQAMDFLEDSRQQQAQKIAAKEKEQKNKIKRARIFTAVIVSAALISIALGVWAVINATKAENQEKIALEQKTIAENEREEAVKMRSEAESQKKIAESQKTQADRMREEAERQKEESKSQRKLAEKQKIIAQNNERIATEARSAAQENERIALINQKKERIQALVVEISKEDARFRQYLTKANALATQSLTITDDLRLKTLPALTAFKLNDKAFHNLKTETDTILEKFDKTTLDKDNEELLESYRKLEEQHQALQAVAAKHFIPRQLFQALRDAYIAHDPTRDILYPGSESWAVAAAAENKFIFSDSHLKALVATLADRKNDTPRLGKESLIAADLPVSAISVLGDRVFIGTSDGRLVHTVLGTPRAAKATVICKHPAKILAMAYSKLEKSLFYSLKNKIFRLRLSDGLPGRQSKPAPVATFKPGQMIRSLAAVDTPGKSLLVAGTSSGTMVYGTAKARGNIDMTPISTGYAGIYSMAYDPNSQLLVMGNANGDLISLQHAASLTHRQKAVPIVLHQKHRGIIRTLAFSRDGKFLASGSYDGSVKLWNLQNKTLVPVLTIPGNNNILSLTFSTDGRYLLFNDGKNLRICPTCPHHLFRLLGKEKMTNFTAEEWKLIMGDQFRQQELK
ncbi:MAG: hypothetical protein GY765_14530 [bacterium]|nr:hypothetical protein [bacterium]